MATRPGKLGPKSGEHDDGRIFTFSTRGFHGDDQLLKLVDKLVTEYDVDCFVETGTAEGSTLAYVSRMYPHLECHSYEHDPRAVVEARKNIGQRANAYVWEGSSVDTLNYITHDGSSVDYPPILDCRTLFWLDAHSQGGGLPIREELDAIRKGWNTGGWILIDDFKVETNSDFPYDSYEGIGELSLDFIDGWDGNIYFPSYPPSRVSRGWVLLTFGDVVMPEMAGVLTLYSPK